MSSTDILIGFHITNTAGWVKLSVGDIFMKGNITFMLCFEDFAPVLNFLAMQMKRYDHSKRRWLFN